MYPFKVNTGGHKIEWIKAEIIENRWAPNNAGNDIYNASQDYSDRPWNGFLSLHKTTETVLSEPKDAKRNDYINKAYYEQVPKRGEREYKNFTLGNGVTSQEYTTENSEQDDKYRVEKHQTEANTYNIYIPMYTRAKQMIIWSGYTGNNPYVAYQRKAKVKITTKLEGLDAFENEVPIYQVRRIVNPKGIYRSANNNSSFHVVLKRLPKENAEKFVTFQSEGPWKAYIVVNNGEGITLSETPGKSELKSDKAIHGKTGSIIDFNVNFSGTPTGNRYAIIRVEYHNYTCQHLIFVRQGDQPDDLDITDPGAKNNKWYAMNMRTKSELASTPLDEGSLFKFGNWEEPIDALNNKNPREPWINVQPTDFKVYPEGGFTIAGTTDKKTWKEIKYQGEDKEFSEPGMENARVATAEDYWELRQDYIEQGYGVLYGDDAMETADNIEDVYGYDYENNQSGRGMRGCFVYNRLTGKNLFFPIGASGYGHRKQEFVASWGDSETLDGVLRYAAGRSKSFIENGRPLLYDIYKRPGAIYWYNKKGSINDNGTKNCLGWDFNYFTFDFNYIETGNLIRNGKSDACFIRCVVKE